MPERSAGGVVAPGNGSMAAMTLYLVVTAAWTGARPRDWPRALPDGYGLPLVACLAFGAGGVVDLIWHTQFGIERTFSALISPTHMFLMGCAGVIATGPLAAAWRRPGRRIGWPGVASAAFLLAAMVFVTQFDHPFTSRWAAAPQGSAPEQMAQQLGILAVILQSALIAGVVLPVVRRFDMPFGAMTVVIGYSAVMITLIQRADPIMLVGILTGLAADILLVVLRPSPTRTRELRVFAFAVPTVLFTLYFAAILAAGGSWWPVHLWAGAPLLAGITGLLVSLLVAPPSDRPAAERA